MESSETAQVAPPKPGKAGRPPAKSDPNQCTKPGCLKPKTNAESTNPWCAEHWGEYLSGYRKDQGARATRKGFLAGANAMKAIIVEQMRAYGAALLTAAEFAQMVHAIDLSDLQRQFDAEASKP